MSSVSIRRDGAASIIAIDRPQLENRFNQETIDGVREALEAAERDAEIRVVVLTGSGTFFSAGGQVDGFPEGGVMVQDRFARAFITFMGRAATLSKPIVAAVNGPAAAGGVGLVVAADLAIAAESATFALPELHGGQFPLLALATAVHALPKKIVFDMIYNARKLSAQEARDLGLVNAVVPDADLEAELRAQVAKLATLSPTAIGFGRRAYAVMRDLDLMHALEYGNTMLGHLLSTDDAREAWNARVEGRKPIWQGR